MPDNKSAIPAIAINDVNSTNDDASSTDGNNDGATARPAANSLAVNPPAASNLVVQCPTCKKPVRWHADFPHRPFCSARCQQIDFGDWISENHAIPGASLDDQPWREDDDEPTSA